MKAETAEQVLCLAKLGVKLNLQDTKEKAYSRIIEYLEVELYPIASTNFKEANISDLVFTILSLIMSDFNHKSNRTGTGLRLTMEKEIISVDLETGGMEEFIVMDVIP